MEDVSLTVREGEFLAVIGPSGAGKTTILRMLAGFEKPSGGEIFLGEREITQLPPHKRDTGMVFQDYALFPHMSVRENIAFGLKNEGLPKDEIEDRITEVLEMVDLPGFEDRKTTNLSGGQQQRVATARALAIEPDVLLMDEPLGALDKKLRDQLEVKVIRLQKELGITTMYVTHNQEEALKMADRVAVMNQGTIEQIDPPEKIYHEPATEFVADFIGDTNFIEGSVVKENGSSIVESDGTKIKANSTSVSDDAHIFVRPERMTIESEDYEGPGNAVPATIDEVIFVGSKTQYYVTALDSEFVIEIQNDGPTANSFTEGEEVTVVWDEDDVGIVEG
ncbi:ABC transporter ATP-binding protein [Natrarchaeobius oligotrophus]|uniref:ABC transporter ATP-binding protein n=1 Tax=Natrarchaeobius oligotrophus TaxID=3455743 RepID=UPI001A9E66DC|nr:ABC transporter ATP-binding protein [Natrarchaeobius chitinivorans]